MGIQKVDYDIFDNKKDENEKEKNDEKNEEEIDEYEIIAERLINKMILLLQLNPLRLDLGVDDEEDIKDEFSEQSDVKKKIDLKNELKDDDPFAADMNDDDGIGNLPLILNDVPMPPRPRRASIENVDRFTSKKMMVMSSKSNIFDKTQQQSSERVIGKKLKRAVSSLYLSGSPDAPVWISRIPENVEEHKTAKMILYLLKKPYSPTMIRDSICSRRIRARRRAMGLKLFSSLFEHTTSKVLHEEVAGLLAAAMKQCKLQRVLDVEEQRRRDSFKKKQ